MGVLQGFYKVTAVIHARSCVRPNKCGDGCRYFIYIQRIKASNLDQASKKAARKLPSFTGGARKISVAGAYPLQKLNSKH
jgi:hypothetical protein